MRLISISVPEFLKPDNSQCPCIHLSPRYAAEELRAEIMKRLEILTSAGLIDLRALPAPSDGGTRRRSIGINGE